MASVQALYLDNGRRLRSVSWTTRLSRWILTRMRPLVGLLVIGVAATGAERTSLRCHAAMDLDFEEAVRGVPPLLRARLPTSRAATVAESLGREEDGARIDLLYLYTDAQVAEVGGDLGALLAWVDIIVAEANQAYADSGIVQRLHLVAAERVDYVQDPAGNTFLDLDRLQNPNDGYADEAHDLRDQYAADIVALSNTTSYSVAAWTIPSYEGSEMQAFTVVGLGGFVLAHEIGHLHGVLHDRYESNDPSFLREMDHPFAFGYISPAAFDPGGQPDQAWGTIMANSAPAERIHRFSNPDRTYRGNPTGVPGVQPSVDIAGPADARRMHNIMGRSVANYRTAPCFSTPMGADAVARTVRLQASDGRYAVTTQDGDGAVRADRMQAGPQGRFTLVDHNGGCVESGDSVSLRTADGLYFSAALGGGSDLTTTDRQVTPWERFTIRRRGTGPVRSGDIVTLQASSGNYISAESGDGGSVNAAYALTVPEPDGPPPGPSARFKITNWSDEAWTHGPDHAVRAITSNVAAVAPLEPFSLTATVSHFGSIPFFYATLGARFYRSADASISPDDEQVGRVVDYSRVYPRGGSVTLEIKLAAPRSPGRYYYGACADWTYRDINPGNNCSTVGVEIVVTSS